jgi:hypothetical protein
LEAGFEEEEAGFAAKSNEAQSLEKDCCGFDYYCFFGRPKSKEKGLHRQVSTSLKGRKGFLPSSAS